MALETSIDINFHILVVEDDAAAAYWTQDIFSNMRFMEQTGSTIEQALAGNGIMTGNIRYNCDFLDVDTFLQIVSSGPEAMTVWKSDSKGYTSDLVIDGDQISGRIGIYIAVVDYDMRPMNGLELARAWRMPEGQFNPYGSPLIIFRTGKDQRLGELMQGIKEISPEVYAVSRSSPFDPDALRRCYRAGIAEAVTRKGPSCPADFYNLLIWGLIDLQIGEAVTKYST